VKSTSTLEHQTMQEREAFRGSEVISEHEIISQHEIDLSQLEVAPLVTLLNQKEGAGTMDAPSGFPAVMMPSMGALEQSPCLE